MILIAVAPVFSMTPPPANALLPVNVLFTISAVENSMRIAPPRIAASET